MSTSQPKTGASAVVPWEGPDGPLGLTGRERHRLAAVLVSATRDERRLTPFAERYPELTVADAYRISRVVLQDRLDRGERVAALTIDSTCADGALPDVPRLGWLTDAMLTRADPCVLPAAERTDVVARVALELHGPPPADCGAAELLDVVGAVYPCLEVVASRYRDGSRTIEDEIADNCGAVLLAAGQPARIEADLRAARGQLVADGTPSRSARCDVLGAAADMVRELQRARVALSPGLWLAVRVGPLQETCAPDAQVHAHFDGIGSVAVQVAAP